jgi:LPS-assembly lipoprotein
MTDPNLPNTAPTLSSLALRRRGLLGLGGLGLLGLGGCGFKPLYGAGPDGVSSAVASELGAVRVALLPERIGQLLRRALQERLWAGGQSSPRYTLTAYVSMSVEPEGVRTTGLATRLRYITTANWWLVTNEVPPKPVANGSERSLDAYNIPDNQFFASDASREAMTARQIEQVAEDIVNRMAIHFQGQQPA